MFGDVASANVVGYAQSDLDHFTIATPQFVEVGNTAQFDITSIKPIGAGDGQVILNTLDGEGYGVGSYGWWDWGGSDIGWSDGAWFIDKGVVLFDASTSFWIQNESGSIIPLQSSGQVGQDAVTFPLMHFTVVGNPFPVADKLNDIVPLNAADGQVILNTLDSEGYGVDSYGWWDWGGSDIGWSDGAWFIDDTIVANPGQAYWVQNEGGDGISLFIPAPEL